ncbi:MAG: hypothetical protein ACYS26_22505, partial [Planctomycetota bacterium]
MQLALLPTVLLGLLLASAGSAAWASGSASPAPGAPGTMGQDEDVLQTAQGWLDQGRPGRALAVLDQAAGPADAARL